MVFSGFQKKIIEYIRDERVYDITSFLFEFGFTKEFCYDEAEIKTQFDESEKGETYDVLKDGLSQGNMTFSPSVGMQYERNAFTEKDFVKKRAVIDYSKLNKTKEFNGKEYRFDFLHPQTVNTDLTKIIDFLIVWQYLKENGLILEIDKQISSKDISIFYSAVTKQGKDIVQRDSLDTPNFIPVELPINKDLLKFIAPATEPPKRDAMNFVSYEIIFDEERLKVCENKIGLKFLPTPELHFFIKRKCKTKEEYFNKASLVLAWIAIIISLVFSIVSFVFEIVSYNDSQKDMAYYSNQIEIIQRKIDSIDKNTFNQNEIENILNEIKDELTQFKEDMNAAITPREPDISNE